MLITFSINCALGARDAIERYPHQLNVICVEKYQHYDESLCKNFLRLACDDLDDQDIEKINRLSPAYPPWTDNYTSPEKEHILAAMQFSLLHKIDIIHCAAGISRSPAIAYAILRINNYTPEQAINKVTQLAPHCLPNQRIIRLTEEIINKHEIPSQICSARAVSLYK